MERRYLPKIQAVVQAEARAGEADPFTLRGYAAVFYDGTPDTEYELWPGVVERVMPGAFDQALKEGNDARALFNHDPNQLLGRVSAKTLDLTKDQKGLLYRISLGRTTVARDVLEHVTRGDLQGSSFAFEVLDEDFRREAGVVIREVKGVRLYDVGPVTFPAYESTTVNARSSEALGGARKALEAFLERERATVAFRGLALRRAQELEFDLGGEG